MTDEEKEDKKATKKTAKKKTEEKEAKMSVDEIIDALGSMTVLELSQLVKALDSPAEASRSVLIQVPYRSQHDSDAQLARADCGPACIAILLEWRGVAVAVDDISRMTGMGYTNAGQLISAAASALAP